MKEPRKAGPLPGVRQAVSGAVRQAADHVVGPDGRTYPKAVDDELNRLAHHLFSTYEGNRFLDYLKNITINATFDHTVSNDTLRHMEGQRFIVGVLVARSKVGGRE